MSALSPLVVLQLEAEFNHLWEDVVAVPPPWNEQQAADMLHKHWCVPQPLARTHMVQHGMTFCEWQLR